MTVIAKVEGRLKYWWAGIGEADGWYVSKDIRVCIAETCLKARGLLWSHQLGSLTTWRVSKVAIAEDVTSKSSPSQGKAEVSTATHGGPARGGHDGYDGGLGALGAMETDFLSLRTDMAKIKLQMSELLTVPWTNLNHKIWIWNSRKSNMICSKDVQLLHHFLNSLMYSGMSIFVGIPKKTYPTKLISRCWNGREWTYWPMFAQSFDGECSYHYFSLNMIWHLAFVFV